MFHDVDAEVLSRRPGTKWGEAGPGVLPAWIAEMDFPPAPVVRDALLRCVSEDLGYPSWDAHPGRNPLRAALAERMEQRYGLVLDPGEVREFTDINQALQAVLMVTTQPGDTIAAHTPTYPPFLRTLETMDRRLLAAPYVPHEDGWAFSADRLAEDVAVTGCRVLLLVSPHNPTGHVLRRAELEALAEIVLRHDMLVVSDEIHSELVHEPHQHIPFASLGPELAARTVTLTSATKAFNVPGVRCAVGHIGPRGVREALSSPSHLYGEPNNFGVAATLAAWREGDSWLSELRPVLAANALALKEQLPAGVGYRVPEASYLAWLDCRDLDLPSDPRTFFHEKARVLLNDGRAFGPEGEGFVRLNFGTSPALLAEITRRMSEAVG
ncbi:MalY/PatB family protein [Streptomyces sp. NPDC059398]|uniref:MalY/PatB family protein n=1 Tax=Streptomyces sp. NPDC059398 TaxID=3346820 RepID=UPI0036AFFBC1